MVATAKLNTTQEEKEDHQEGSNRKLVAVGVAQASGSLAGVVAVGAWCSVATIFVLVAFGSVRVQGSVRSCCVAFFAVVGTAICTGRDVSICSRCDVSVCVGVAFRLGQGVFFGWRCGATVTLAFVAAV